MKPKNGKAKSGSKSYGKEKKPRKARAPKPTAEALSDQERQKQAFALSRELAVADAEKKEAADNRKSVTDKIKATGFTVKQIELLNELKTGEGQETFKIFAAQTAEVVRWSGVGVQLGLFGDPRESKADKLFEDGKRAAFDDQPARPPDQLSQKDAQRWLAGHAEGRTLLNSDRASGFKPMSDVVANLAEKAGIAGALGTEPPTHQEVH